MSRVVLCVGHQSSAKGAVAVNGVTEWDFNESIVDMIKKNMSGIKSIEVVCIKPDVKFSKKARNINHENPTLALEFHFNAAEDPRAEGVEVLHYAGSKNGRKLAELLCNTIAGAFSSKNRGSKPIAKRSDRGGSVLIDTICPCVILEPFFGSNHKETELFMSDEGKQKYASAVAKALAAYFGVVA